MANGLQESLAKKFEDAGIHLPNSDQMPEAPIPDPVDVPNQIPFGPSSPPLGRAPGPVRDTPPMQAVLPPDVAARVDRQNAVAETGPTSAPPPAPVVPYRPPAGAKTKAEATPDPLAAQLARAGGGGAAPFANPYANQIAAAEGLKGPLLNQQIGLQNVAAERGASAQGAVDEGQRYAGEVRDAAAANQVEEEKLRANHEALVKSESARDYTKEFFAQKTTGQRIAGGIASMLGGFLQGWNHLSTNPAIEQQNKEVDRYIDQAKAKSALKIGESRDLYSHFLDKTKNEAAARALSHAAVLEGFRTKLEEAAADSKDQEEMARAAEGAKQIDMQIAGWKDAATIAQKKAAAGAAPMTVQQLAALQQTLANTRHTQAETAALEAKTAGTAQGNPVAASAAQDLERAAAANGGQIPGTGPLDRALASASHGEGIGAALARSVRGEGAMRADASKFEIASQAMQAMNPHMRPTKEAIANFEEQEGLTHGSPEQQREAIARMRRLVARQGPGAALQAQAAGADETPEGFAEP